MDKSPLKLIKTICRNHLLSYRITYLTFYPDQDCKVKGEGNCFLGLCCSLKEETTFTRLRIYVRSKPGASSAEDS
jgi:hypothetical protein